MASEYQLHLVRMNRGLMSDTELDNAYRDSLARIEEQTEEIKRETEILTILEGEFLRRREEKTNALDTNTGGT